jgi:hypothetical protein
MFKRRDCSAIALFTVSLWMSFVFSSAQALADTQQAKKIWEKLITTDPNTSKATPEVKKLMGHPIEVMGYMIINESENGQITEFLLTRMPGGCIHVPPPPANSIIHVKMNPGKTAKYFVGQILVKGKIELGGRMDAVYEMTADSVENVPAT